MTPVSKQVAVHEQRLNDLRMRGFATVSSNETKECDVCQEEYLKLLNRF
jgi:hypothetical protein